MASSSNSPCAACKFLRRKCTPECVFAPYFPPDSPQKFANVHKVFGASNVSKLLNELPPSRREDAVNSLAYEADARLSDPVYGCVGVISLLQHQLKQLQADLLAARAELSRYMAAAGIPGPLPPSFLQAAAVAAHHQQQYQHHHHSATSAAVGIGMGLPGAASREQLYREQQQQQQQLLESQQMAVAVAMAAREQQEMMRNYEHGGDIGRFGGAGYDQGVGAAGGSGAGSGSVGGGLGFNAFALSPAASPSSSGFISPIQAHHHHQQQQQQRSVGGEDRKPCSSGSVGGGGGCGGSGGAGSTGLSS
ncbi:LOB domain-containing protein 6 [Nymphaea thermarum]|nr:LOB domain-containing protein 6 [Nymphaea thermarum]